MNFPHLLHIDTVGLLKIFFLNSELDYCRDRGAGAKEVEIV
jgi:hypothetical protein